MSAMPVTSFNMEPAQPQSVRENASLKNNPTFRLVVVICVLNSLLFIFTLLSIIMMVRVNQNVSELSDKMSHLIIQKSVGSTDSTSPVKGGAPRQVGGSKSKSFLLRGFDTTDGFNITVEFPNCKSAESGTELSELLKLVEELRDNLESGCGSSTSSSSDGGVLKVVKNVRDSLSAIANNQGIILSKLNTSSSVSQTAALQRIESTIVQQTLSVQNRIGDLEDMVIQTKTEINSFQKSLADIQADISQIKFTDGVMNVDVASIKTKVDNLSSKSNCADVLSPLLTTMKRDVQNINSKAEKMQGDVSSLVTGDKSLSSVSSTISEKILRLETYSIEMKQKCQASETKLTEVLAKVGVPTKPPTSSFAQVGISYCSANSGCNTVAEATTHCYKVSNTKEFTWTTAREACKRLGGYLAEIDSETESREVANMLTNKGNYWIGGTDKAVNERWQWNYSGKSVSMNAWRSENPSSIEYFSCMGISDDGWSWRSLDCDNKADFVCEKEANDCRDWMTN